VVPYVSNIKQLPISVNYLLQAAWWLAYIEPSFSDEHPSFLNMPLCFGFFSPLIIHRQLQYITYDGSEPLMSGSLSRWAYIQATHGLGAWLQRIVSVRMRGLGISKRLYTTDTSSYSTQFFLSHGNRVTITHKAYCVESKLIYKSPQGLV